MTGTAEARRVRPTTRRPPAEGVLLRHSRRCASRQASKCSCRPTYQAQVWVAAEKRCIRRTFATLAEARAWRGKTHAAVLAGEIGAPSKVVFSDAAERWLEGAERGHPNPLGCPLQAGLASHLPRRASLPRAPGLRLASALGDDPKPDAGLRRRSRRQGLSASTVHNAVMPVRVILGRAVKRGELASNPTLGLTLPSGGGRRDRVAPPEEARALIEALPEGDRAIWATALYAGLRRGELQALRWEDVSLEGGLIRVRHGWDRVAGLIEPKSRSAKRRVPVPEVLRGYLVRQRLRTGGGEDVFVFASSGGRPFDAPTVGRRAFRAWAEAELEPITLHECRHTFASLMIAAGVNTKALSTYLGHASITITLDRYGHLLPGNEREAATRLDEMLRRHADTSTLRRGGADGGAQSTLRHG